MTRSDLAALREVVKAWDDAINSGDVGATLNLYVDEKPKAMPPHAALAEGKPAIRKAVEALHAQGKLTVRDELLDADVSGEKATMYGTFRLHTVTKTGDSIDDVGKWVCLCRREGNGDWKIVYNVWNSDSPLAEQ